ncbi:hypothetical protein DL93DRAFT_2069130 [Clavulina sp. PMI_390]|nr:hypothetical protein DL93DRAFT_2069130 [Clavulina sp. PMI_390]
MDIDEPTDEDDVLPRIRNMFRLLELYSEQGSSGLVEKVLISQESVCDLIETLCPGASAGITSINFNLLDTLLLKPLGMYGSKTALIDHLVKLGAVDESTELILRTNETCLKSGIYIIPTLLTSAPNAIESLVLFWPEPSTWDDDCAPSVERNRVTFMRYLMKLTDQIVALISKDHSDTMTWTDATTAGGHSLVHNPIRDARLYTFEVLQTVEQEESVSLHPGFELRLPQRIQKSSSNGPIELEGDLRPRLVPGETCQGILRGEWCPEVVQPRPERLQLTTLAIRDRFRDTSRAIILGANLSHHGLNVLANNGLSSRFPTIVNEWKSTIGTVDAEYERDLKHGLEEMQVQVRAEVASLKKAMYSRYITEAFQKYPCVPTLKNGLYGSHVYLSYRALGDELHPLTFDMLHLVHDAFMTAKRSYITARRFIQENPEVIGSVNLGDLDSSIASGQGGSDMLQTALASAQPSKHTSFLSRFFTFGGKRRTRTELYDEYLKAGDLPNADLISMIANTPAYNPLPETCVTLRRVLAEGVVRAIKKTTKTALGAYERRQNEERTSILEQHLKQRRSQGYKAAGELATNKINSSRQDFSTHPAHIKYTLEMLQLKADDSRALSMNPNHAFDPQFPQGAKFTFQVYQPSKLRFIQLLPHKRCLALIDDPHEDKTHFFCTELQNLDHAIMSHKTLFRLSLEKFEIKYLVTVNESRRLVAVLSPHNLQLTILVIDEQFSIIQARGHPMDLRQWLPPSSVVTHVAFISGSEEIVLLTHTGVLRIFSLITEQCKPSTAHISSAVSTLASSPDGSCIVALAVDSTLHCFHTASFGVNNPIQLPLPPQCGGDCILSSFERRGIAHWMGLDCETGRISSSRLEIITKASEYTFSSNASPGRRDGEHIKGHVVLVKCFSDVWNKFPVQPTIARRTPALSSHPRLLLFVAHGHLEAYEPQFRAFAQHFERSTHKPTGGTLDELRVKAMAHEAFNKFGFLDGTIYPFGRWLVEFICLIPLHLAIASGNQFVPLKDGVRSAEFEQSLLGSDVLQIAESITLGWYESILSTYLANKPVKVVSSLGEQSVGKSYALNHFLDTSFAGSAMRCTEGAWMSLTEADDCVIVALDFEGIHSIERNVQEDMLLVLFNSAMSNMVLFRNNFALSRDIAGNALQSFQSCAALLDPASNPQLFGSILCIIIKVCMEDIACMFSSKFRAIVQREREGNFISKLHRGKLDIMPWPVIESPQFYTLMNTLKARLEEQNSTHGSVSMFVHNMKILMAKLRASDWGAIDHNLATHRARVLTGRLEEALQFGKLLTNDELSELSNLDDFSIIEHSDTATQFPFLIGGVSDGSLRDETLRTLATVLQCNVNRQNPQWIMALGEYINNLVELRVRHVNDWVDSNVKRFAVDHADIQILRRQFGNMARQLQSAMEICTMPCTQCRLGCIRGRRHDGPHDCFTDHTCPEKCTMDSSNCGFSAGHDGEHLCSVAIHLCGEPCKFNGRRGCQTACVEPRGHAGDEHVCSAQVHECGLPCDLAHTSPVPLCDQPCVNDCRRGHERHVCASRLTCPVTCQLCARLCTVGDHFHALSNDAVHLCGQVIHLCTENCSSPGICDISSVPLSVESTFIGRNETFRFTKYTQESKRLRCVVPIPPNDLYHSGEHTHSLKAPVFHFCEVRCPSCQYFCTLPLGHPQDLHETSHGSMERSMWAVDQKGSDQGGIEIQGHHFSSGDSGAPMLCSVVCSSRPRHIHIDYCRAIGGACNDVEVEHIDQAMHPHPEREKDWISHRLFWARSDPYSREEQDEFSKCDACCPDEEHSDRVGAPNGPSYCVLPLFHERRTLNAPSPADGYISADGHRYHCKDPSTGHGAYHIIFALDYSGSMNRRDRQPLQNTPATYNIAQVFPNRFGAVLSALYSFLMARNASLSSAGGSRRDWYSVILFDNVSKVVLQQDDNMDPNEILETLLHAGRPGGGGTDFTQAIFTTRRVMNNSWSDDHQPVIIFLSDGEAPLPQDEMQALCEDSADRGQLLSFYSVAFGSHSEVLQHMAQTVAAFSARQVQSGAFPSAPPAEFTGAIDTIQLAETFLNIAESMRTTRAALIRS